MTAIYAAIGASVGFAVLTPAATLAIHAVVDFHDRHTNTTALPIRPNRPPIAALTAHPHHEAVDELGPWKPSQHQLAPAAIHDALIGATR